MQAMPAALKQILTSQSRNAVAEIVVQGPNPLNTLQQGSQLILDGVTKITVQRNEESTSDTLDFELANPDGRYSPIRSPISGLPNNLTTDSYPDALHVGSVNWKTLAYLGLQNQNPAPFSQLNLYHNSDSLSSTTLTNMTLGIGGPGATVDAEYIGDGTNQGHNFTSAYLTVTPGLTYTPSWWIDMSNVTHGDLDLQVHDITGAVISDTAGGSAAGNIAQRYAAVPFTCPNNFAPNSDSLTGWGIQGLTLGTGGLGGSVDAEQTGTGTSGPTAVFSYLATVTPGATYSASFWIDQSSTTSGGTNGLIGFGDITGFGSLSTNTTVAWGAAAGRFARNNVKMPVNLSPEPYSSWTLTGSMVASTQTSGPATYQRFSFTSGTAATATSPLIPVTAGQLVSLSAQVIGTYVSGSVTITAIDQTGAAVPGFVLTRNSTSASRSGTINNFTVPAGVTGMRLVVNSNSSSWTGSPGVQTISFVVGADPGGYLSTSDPRASIFYEIVAPVTTSGQKLKVNQPMLEKAAAASGYYISSQNPQISVNVFAWTGQSGGFIVASGQKFKISQPMLRTDGVTSPYQSSQVSQEPYSASLIPQGTYLVQSAGGGINQGAVTQSAHGFDISFSFSNDVSVNLPHTLFGNQTDVRYDPAYNLSNPSADLKTYVCDAKNFMAALTDNIFLKADYALLFTQAGGANAVNVYVGTPGSPASTPVSPASYTWNPVTGTVTFSAAQASNAIVSIDGVPQSMAPELMLYHLFNDYGHYSPAYFKFQTSNIQLPIYTGGTDSVWHIAQNVAAMTAPRGVAWRLRIDEFGYIQFYEDKYASMPTEVIVDERDIYDIQYTYTAESLSNVVTASAIANNQQPIKSISYDIDSINDNGQRQTYEIDSTLLVSLRGSTPLLVKSLLDGITASNLTDKIRPTLELTVDLVPNPARQVGDKVTLIEQTDGLSANYIIKGLTHTTQEGKLVQKARLRRSILYSNFNMGMPSAITNSPAPGTIGASPTATSTSVNATVTGRTGIIKTVTIGGTTAINKGAVVKDANGFPVIPSVSGASWNFGFTIDPTQNYDTAVFQAIYLECPNTLSSTDIMAIRAGTWVSNDGATITAATIAGGYSQSYTHTTGTALAGSETAYLYGNLAFLAHPNILTPSYPAVYSNLTYLSQTNLTGQIGMGLGSAYTGSYAYLPQAKMTYGWYVIQATNAAGASQIVRVPFVLAS